MEYLIVGMTTGSGEIETWQSDDEKFCRELCISIVRNTGHKVYVIDGKVIGTYELEDLPVKYTDNSTKQ